MIPIQDLLNRIIWDTAFSQGSFEIGYYDRVEDRIIKVALQQIELIKGDHFTFKLIDQYGETCSIPYHRIREVYKDGQLIWSRM